MIRRRLSRWIQVLLIACGSGMLFQVGCLRNIQQNLDLLWAPEANLDHVYQSELVDLFGAGILKFW